MRYLFLFLLITVLFLPHTVKAQWGSSINLQQDEVNYLEISTPAAGQVVQGAVIVRGNTTIAGF
jgi:hypothetical protein